MLRRSSLRLKLLARRVLREGGSPERVARGLAAGFFAAAFPLPGLQIPLSLLFAWLVRGNKTIAVFPQFLSNTGTMLPLAYIQFWLGTWLWPRTAGDVELALAAVGRAARDWSWLEIGASVQGVGHALAGLSADVLGPLSIGVIVTAVVMAVLSYPVGLIAANYVALQRQRRRAMRGIRPRPPQGPLRLPAELVGELRYAPAAIQAYSIHPERHVRAQAAYLLFDGEQAYPQMLGAIQQATRFIALETYILRADRTGNAFGRFLIEAARRGVEVRLLYDGVGGFGVPQEYVNWLTAAGIQIRVFRPISTIWRRGVAAMNRRDHRKILVVDNQIGFTGGVNLAHEHASRNRGGGGWRDTHVRIDGAEPARRLAALFEETWEVADPSASPAGATPPAADKHPVTNYSAEEISAAFDAAPTCTDVQMQILGNREFLQRVRIRRAYLHAIHNAKRYILIENAYFIPDRGIRRALQKAVRRGVSVCVTVAMYSDVAVAAMASRAVYGELLASGVRLYEYPVTMLHSKVATIDDIWSLVGSYNLDHRSLLHNLEAGMLVLDRHFARRLRDQIMKDIGQSREVTLCFHQSRPWRDALLETLAYQIRYWL